jgi:hypothetical protein
MGKNFFGGSKRQRRCFLEGKIDLKSDVSAEDYEKRKDLDEIWPKRSLIFCFWMGKIPFLAD